MPANAVTALDRPDPVAVLTAGGQHRLGSERVFRPGANEFQARVAPHRVGRDRPGGPRAAHMPVGGAGERCGGDRRAQRSGRDATTVVPRTAVPGRAAPAPAGPEPAALLPAAAACL